MSISQRAIRAVRGVGYFLTQNTVDIAIRLTYFMLIARLISVEDMGVYSLLVMIYALFQIIAWSLKQAPVKYIAEYLGKGKVSDASAVARRMLQITIIIAVLSSSIYFLTSQYISVAFTGSADFTLSFQVLAVSILFVVIYPTTLGFLQGLQRLKDLALIMLTVSAIRHILALLLLVFMGLPGVIIGWFFGDGVGTVAAIVVSRKSLPQVNYLYSLKPLIFFSLPLLASNLLNYVSSWIDRFLLVIFTSLDTVGVYHVSVVAVEVIQVVPMAISMVLFPQFSEIFGETGKEAFLQSFKKATRYISYLYFPIVFGAMTVSQLALVAFVGSGYIESASSFVIMAVGSIGFALFVPLSSILLSLGETRKLLYIAIVSTVIQTIAMVSIIPNFGVIGAASAKLLFWPVEAFLAYYVVRRHVSVDFDREALVKASISSTIMAMIVYVAILIQTNVYLLPVYVLIGVVSYMILLKATNAIRTYDAELVESVLPKKMKFIKGFLKLLMDSTR